MLIFLTLFLSLIMIGCTELGQSGGNNAPVQKYESDVAFDKGSEMAPTAKTLYSMAEILSLQGRDSNCEFVLKQCINDYPNFTPAYNALAEVQRRQSRINDAIKTLQQGAEIVPPDPVVLNNLGMCWLMREEYEKALDMFTQAAGILPEKTRYRANMAVALAFMERDDEALSLFMQVLPADSAENNLQILKENRHTSRNPSGSLAK
ncbi:MAG: tetratricopeptide repeat protein [Planctomycetota bacterium]|jgi:Flp pilus assembly protein TadD